MITNLFSRFDPSTSIFLPFNWTRALVILVVLTPLYWKIPNNKTIVVRAVTQKLHQEFKTLIGQTTKNGATLLFISLFILILINNLIGLFPYIFTASRHLTITLSLALPLWLRFILYGWISNATHIFAHIVPNGTPGALIPLIVLIESVRNLIRPVTLSVRLIANIMAGHLLITLIGNQTAAARNLILVSLVAAQILLLTLERAVAIIQSYVFAVLSRLYSREVVSH